MANIIASPTRYIQGKGELRKIRQHTEMLGAKMFILTTGSGRQRIEPAISESVAGSDCTAVYEAFRGECSQREIDRVVSDFQKSGCDLIIGIGGGKTHDTAKAAAYIAGCPVVIVPTIASTDAPCSALSVIYTDDGVFDRYLFLPASPNVVLVDTEIVSKAPARLLVAGMGDALATYFEARACQRSNATNCVGGNTTLAAMALARLCYSTLMADGRKAAVAAKAGACTRALENIVEANTYLSGVGFESGGLAGAHAIHNGLTAIPETHQLYHGEKVAFGTLVQLVLEDEASEQIQEVIHFCTDIGLPTTLADLGIPEIKPKQIHAVAELACAPGDTLGNMPFAVTSDAVYDAILGADAIGRKYKEIHA